MRQTDPAALARLWDGLGVVRGSVVLCHSFLPSLGKVMPGPEAVLDSLLEAVGPEGTLAVPTFSYSWFRGEDYDVQSSPGTVGLLGELLRGRPGALRGRDPCFSNAAIGPRAPDLLRRDVIQSFGPGSFYDKLVAADARVVLLGVDFTALPLFMHIERLFCVGYRYDKLFRGSIIDAGRRTEEEMVHFVRSERLDPESDRTRIGAHLDASGACAFSDLGYGRHRAIQARTVVDMTLACLGRDPFFLIKQPV